MMARSLAFLVAWVAAASAFTHVARRSVASAPLARRPRASSARASAAAIPVDASPAAPAPGRFALTLGGKRLNPVGALFGLSMTAWVVVLYPMVLTCAAASRLFDRARRRPMDAMVRFWAKISMLTCGYRPKLVGAENLPEKGAAALYVPNHGSYLDIFTLSAFLPRDFKYISKIEILRIPLIGWAMGFAGHIALRRADRRSQLESYRAAVASLKAGNSLVAFAEGTRTPDGRLRPFKRGPFKMALDAGVDVIPIALCDVWKYHPPSAIMPLAVPRGVEIKVLPPVKTQGRTADELMAEVQAAVDAALPPHQRSPPKPKPAAAVEAPPAPPATD